MGLIKALTSSVSSGLGDQFKEFVVCPEIDKNVLIQRGEVRHGDGNKNPSEGIITNGSGIVVPEGMCMLLIDNGAIVEFVSESGTYKYDSSTEPTVFEGGFFKGIKETIKTIGNRITYGGQTAHDQRVYYINTLVIKDNKFGSPQPKKITDEKYGMLEVTFFGEYAFQVVDPAKLISNVIGTNAKDTITVDEVVGSQLKAKFVEQLTQAIAVVMRKAKVSFGDMALYGSDLSKEMNNCLDDSWRAQYGLEITDVAIGDINLTEDSMKRINKIDDAQIFSNPSLQAGLMANATSEALTNAASNANGAMMGFAGMNMANNAGNNLMNAVKQNTDGLPALKNSNQPEQGTIFATEEKPAEKTDTPTEPTVNFCSNCGAKATGNFCANCGAKLN